MEDLNEEQKNKLYEIAAKKTEEELNKEKNKESRPKKNQEGKKNESFGKGK